MARDEDAMSGKIHAAITLTMRRIAKKNASTRPWCEFVRHGRGGVGITKATKNAKRRIVGVCFIKSEVGRRSTNGFGGEAIEDVSDAVKSFYPKTRRQTSLK
jgi:hypothetical protein